MYVRYFGFNKFVTNILFLDSKWIGRYTGASPVVSVHSLPKEVQQLSSTKLIIIVIIKLSNITDTYGLYYMA